MDTNMILAVALLVGIPLAATVTIRDLRKMREYDKAWEEAAKLWRR